jgi:hypothetical protein
MRARSCTILALVALWAATPADAQFRRGLFAESTEVTLYPLDPPAVLLPAGPVQLQMRNASGASPRILERIERRLKDQLSDNDARLQLVDRDAGVTIVATLTEWKESRRNSTKYVSEKRQVGTREVTGKDGKKRSEPVYEYGRNRPSVVVSAAAGIRLEVLQQGDATLADETARHVIQDEYLMEAGPPSREQIEDQLIDRVVQRGAGRISPGRQSVHVMLARSDEVDRLNDLAKNRRWDDWLSALDGVKPHGNRARDAYRLHNLAVAHEALAYEATDLVEWHKRLAQASALMARAAAQNPKEKYIGEAAERIARSQAAYRQLAGLYQGLGMESVPAARAEPIAPPSVPHSPAGSAAPAASAPVMTNQDVIDLRAAGLDDENLLAAIAEAKAVRFDLSPKGLKALLEGKVSNPVIAAMRARAQ